MDHLIYHTQMIIDENVVPYLIKFVADSEEHLFNTALEILRQILCGSEDQKQAVLDCEMSPCLQDIIRNLKALEHIGDLKRDVAADFIHQLCEKLKEFLGPSEISVSTLVIQHFKIPPFI